MIAIKLKNCSSSISYIEIYIYTYYISSSPISRILMVILIYPLWLSTKSLSNRDLLYKNVKIEKKHPKHVETGSNKLINIDNLLCLGHLYYYASSKLLYIICTYRFSQLHCKQFKRKKKLYFAGNAVEDL